MTFDPEKLLTLDQRARVSRVRKPSGKSGLASRMSDTELAKIIGAMSLDYEELRRPKFLPDWAIPTMGYANTPIDWFQADTLEVDFPRLYLEAVERLTDFEITFECFCELHKRIAKFDRIMSTQRFADISAISPRVLLEKSNDPGPVKANFLLWRKFFHDLDSRAAQETAYIFEPILARALGGESCSSKDSPVRRADDPETGRQVDAIVDGSIAYEFKMRLTEAASGKGRLQHELDFARDCATSGFQPALLVLDGTPSSKMTAMCKQVEDHGGFCLVGDEAWGHIRRSAGNTLYKFIERHVRRHIDEVEECEPVMQKFSAYIEDDMMVHEIQMEDGQVFRKVFPYAG